MKYLLTAVMIGMLATPAFPQSDSASEAGANADPGSGEQARAVLTRVLERYSSVEALTDEIKMTVNAPSGADEFPMAVTIGADDSSKFVGQGLVIVGLDDTMYLQLESLPSKYFQTEIQGSVPDTLESLLGGNPLPFHYAAVSDMSVDDLVNNLNLVGAPNITLADVRETKTEDGATRQQVRLAGDFDAEVLVTINPETHLIERVDSTFRMGPSDSAPTVTVGTTFNTKLMKQLPEPISFQTEGRRQVSTPMELTLGEGDPAPAFTLESSAGGTVSLEELKGNVVVLDFWATWCAPCRKGLPLLEQFHTWAQENDKPIKVFAVNGGQREKTAEARTEAALKYWNAQEFTMPTLLDPESETFDQYVSQGIPLTVIIDPNGDIAAMHVGFDPNMLETLKRETAEVLEDSGAAG